MDATILYTPILKGKANDLKALGKLPRQLSPHVHPLVELLSPNEGESIEASCVRFAHQLRKHCPLNAVSVDLHSIAPTHTTDDGSLALEALCANLRGLGILFTPAFGFDHEPELWPRIAHIAVREGHGLTFRLKLDDLEAGGYDCRPRRASTLCRHPCKLDQDLDRPRIRWGSGRGLTCSLARAHTRFY